MFVVGYGYVKVRMLCLDSHVELCLFACLVCEPHYHEVLMLKVYQHVRSSLQKKYGKRLRHLTNGDHPSDARSLAPVCPRTRAPVRPCFGPSTHLHNRLSAARLRPSARPPVLVSARPTDLPIRPSARPRLRPSARPPIGAFGRPPISPVRVSARPHTRCRELDKCPTGVCEQITPPEKNTC